MDNTTRKKKTMDEISSSIVSLVTGIRAITKRTHAATAISAAAILDAELTNCLKKVFRPLSAQQYGDLFGGMKPLGSFSSKILMAYALRIIDEETWLRLELVRKIRNTLSHSAENLNFGSDQIAPLISKLFRGQQLENSSVDVAFVECVGRLADSLERYQNDLRAPGGTSRR